MDSLSEHNEKVMLTIQKEEWKRIRAGVKCPNCTHKLVEMFFTHPGRFVNIVPLKAEVKCPECGYTGYKYMER